jgi:uncharacterized protein
MRRFFHAAVLALLAAAIFPSDAIRAASTTVVISEFRVRGPNGGSDEFIELYNMSTAPVNIGSWKVNGSNNAAGTSTRATIPINTVLNPGCHYLLTNSSTSGGPYSGSVTGDQTYATGVTDDGGIGLLNASSVVVDQVGMSVGSAYKEGTILSSLGTTNLNRSYERKPGGNAGSATDTDNNLSDFRLITPSDPQNSNSACITLNGPSGVGAASPATVMTGNTTLLTVTVTPGNPPQPITSVVADLSAIGGSPVQPFADNGVYPDAAANDLTYSFVATVPLGTPEGAKSLPVTITDSLNRAGSATIALTVELPPPPFVEIHDIQGGGPTSPYAGQRVATQGIVTAQRFNNGFFIQEPDGQADADPQTSEGIFVFTGTGNIPAAAAVGNLVDVAGTVAEFIPAADPFSPPQTELSGTLTVSTVSQGNALPAPITLTPADTDPAGSIEQLERFEGMRVRVESLTVVAPTQGSVSEANATASSSGVYFGVVTGVARPFREPGVQVPDPLPAGSPCCVPRFDANPERLRVDSNGQVGFSATDTTEVMSGAVVSGIVGVVDYASRAYTILPDLDGQGVVSNTHGAIAVDAPSVDQFTIATANIERFFDTTNDDGVSDVALTQAAFDKRLNKVSLEIRTVMQSPDIVAFEEVENLPTLQAIAAKVNGDAVAAGQASPQYDAYLVEGNDIGGIDVGFLVKSSRVTVNEVQQYGKDATFTNPDTNAQDLLNDRPPLLLRATVHGGLYADSDVTVIANHLRSLNGVDDAATGARVRAKRLAQAEFLARLIQDRQNANAAEHIVAVGDFNAFEVNDGYVDVMNTIRGDAPPADQVVLATAAGDLVEPNLTDLMTLAPADQRYSYSFDGSAQELDHVLVTQSTLAIVHGVEWGRTNADFPETFRSDGTRPERVSDHDPVVAYFRLFDTTAPVLSGLNDVVLEANSAAGAATTFAPTANDAVDGSVSVTCVPASGSLFPIGNTTVNCSAEDASHNTANGSFTVTVHDTTAPTSPSLTVTPNLLWPANHRMVDVVLTATSTDLVDAHPACAIASATSNESDNGADDGNTVGDIVITGPLTLSLRAERSGTGSGRIYTIGVQCQDHATPPNIGPVSNAYVTVPRSR